MLSLSMLAWMTVLGALISFWWQSDKIKHAAIAEVVRLCRQQDLQMLDQTMVLKGISPTRNESGNIVLRRRYGFEFTSTGQGRYQGIAHYKGGLLQSLELEPHILPEDEPRLH